MGDDCCTSPARVSVTFRVEFRPRSAALEDADTSGSVRCSSSRQTTSVRPETHYARSGDVAIAYQVVGDGPFDLVFVPGFISHVELRWTIPRWRRDSSSLAEFARLILFDKRGTGMSDHVTGAPTLEERMDDLRAVMDAAGSARAAVFGVVEGAPMSVLFAATYPDRTAALVLRERVSRARRGHSTTRGDGLRSE